MKLLWDDTVKGICVVSGSSYHKRGHATLPPLVNKTPLNPGSAAVHCLLLFLQLSYVVMYMY